MSVVALIVVTGILTEAGRTIARAAASLTVATRTDRRDAQPLDGAHFGGVVYVTATGPARRVSFAVDNQPVRTERIAPFDLAGTDRATGRARPYDTAGLTPGPTSSRPPSPTPTAR
jgi:hypothetical protein